MRIGALAHLMLAGLFAALPAHAGEDFSTWSHSAKLHYSTTATGANVPMNIVNFPILVRITDTRILTQSMTTGADVRFADEKGNHLDFQIERWDLTVKKAEFWVRLPQVDSLSDKQFLTVFWGKAGSPWLSDGGKVFYQDVGFNCVYHLGEGATQTRVNSVANNNHAVPKNFDGDERVTGVIGMADSLDGAAKDGDYLDLGAGFADLGAFTFNTWAYFSKVGSWERLLDLGNGEGSENLVFARESTGTNITLHAFGTPTITWEGFGGNKAQVTKPLDIGYVSGTGALEPKKWLFLAVVVKDKSVSVYKDGIRVAIGNLKAGFNKIARAKNYLGKSNWAIDAAFTGILDEPQISNSAHSDQWVKLAYESQRPDAKMYTWEFAPEVKLEIKVPPAGLTVNEGNPVKMSVTAVASGSISYQWFKDGAVLTWAKDKDLLLAAATLDDVGMYACRVTDGKDTLMSKNAPLFIPEDFSTWSHSQKLFINTAVGSAADIAGDIANVPVLVRLGKKTLDFTQTYAGGKDLRFAGADGNPLAHAIERWAADTAEVWVRVPKIAGHANGYVTMYWGKAAARQGSSPGYVFSMNDNWRAYYGFNDAPSNGSDTHAQDATLNNFQGSGPGIVSVPAGVIGKAFAFAGNSHIEAPLAATDGLKAYTILLWAREKTASHSGTFLNNPTLAGVRASTGQGDFGLMSDYGSLSAWSGHNTDGSQTPLPGLLNINDGAWHSAAFVYDGSSVRLYGDGLMHLLGSADLKPLASRSLGIGATHFQDGSFPFGFTGDIDAVQILGEAKSADWIRFVSANQAPGSAVLTFGAPADMPPPAPVIDPPTGDYDDAVQILITCAADSTRILYTLDGTDPDTVSRGSTRNIGSNIKLTASGTVKAIAYRKGKASAVASATYQIASTPVTQGDTLKAGGTKDIDGTHRVTYPNQGAKAPVRLTPGPAWNPLPKGFERVGPLFTLTVVDTAAAFPGLLISGDSLEGLSLFRRDANLLVLWMPPKDGQLCVPSEGTYFWARDIQPPRIRLTGTEAHGSDSLHARIVIDDNVAALQGKVRYWNGGQDSLGWWSSASGDELDFTVPVPAKPETPLEVRFSATDQTGQAQYPSAGTITLSRPLPALSAPVALKSGYKWKMAGLPMLAEGEITLRDLAAMSGTGPLYAAVWRNPPAADTGYLILKDKDVLPTGKGFWLASAGGAPGLNFPASRATASDSDGLFTIKLTTGWNLVTCPSFRPIAWPVSVNDGEAYLRSPLKPLHAFADTGYTRPDSLRPWESYYVYYDKDTLVRVGPGAPRVGWLAVNPSAKPGSSAGVRRGLRLGLNADGIALDFGASAFARAGIGIEDERQAPALDRNSAAWMAREGRALAVDYVAWDPARAMAWTVALHGQPVGASVAVPVSELPEGYEAWAVSPARRLKWRLASGGNIPVTGDDTLAIYAGTPAALAKIGDLLRGREAAGAFDARFRAGAAGPELTLDLPSAARIEVGLWSARGETLGGISRIFSPGRHQLSWQALSGGRGFLPQGAYFVVIRAYGPDWTLRRVQSLGVIR